jgi:hypothetical protein
MSWPDTPIYPVDSPTLCRPSNIQITGNPTTGRAVSGCSNAAARIDGFASSWSSPAISTA